MNDKYQGVTEYARTHGISMQTTYQRIWTGLLPARRVDGRWRIPVPEKETATKLEQLVSAPRAEGYRG